MSSELQSASPSPDSRMLLERVRALVPSMSPAHAAVAGVVLANPRGVVRMTVSDLAAVSRSSVGSVVRFCKDLGYRGFHDFKLQLATEASPAVSAAKGGADEAVDSVVETVFRSTARAIEAAAATVDGDQFDQAAVALDRAERILVVSTGPSVPLAIDTVLRFRGAGLTIERSGDPVSQHVCASMLTDRDVCLAISHTGRTRQTVGAAQAARDNGAAVVVVTSFLRSPLTATASVALVAGSAATRFQMEAMMSRFIHLAVLDALYSAVTTMNTERTLRGAALTARAEEIHRL